MFKENLPYVSSTKGATGHMMGAGGITETITCVKAIETGVLPPTINLSEVDPECAGIDFVANTAKGGYKVRNVKRIWFWRTEFKHYCGQVLIYY